MSKAPVIRQVAWMALTVHLALLSLVVAIFAGLTDLPVRRAFWAGALVYLAWSIGTRSILARAHRAGIRRVRTGDFAGAIPCFEDSYAFFSKRPWLDRLRYLLLGSASKACYREMALVNIAFCYGQIGEGQQCRACYERAAAEFPDSVLARAAPNMARSFEASRSQSEP